MRNIAKKRVQDSKNLLRREDYRRVKKGSKVEMVVFWKLQDWQEKNDTGKLVIKQVPILKYYNVFHISQVENVLPLERIKNYEAKPIKKAERILNEYVGREHITLSEGYSKEELIAEITSSAIVHSLGLETEDTFKNNCAYIQNWLSVLKNDKKFIVSATGKAEKAAKYILCI